MKNSRAGLLLILFLALTALLLALFGPGLFGERPAAPRTTPQQIPAVPPSGFTAKGLVESVREVVLSSRVAGEIMEITVEEGDRASAGTVLVRMNDRKVAAQIELSEARLRAAQAGLQEQSSGFRKEDVAAGESAVQRAEAVFEQAEVEAQRQKRLLEKGATPRVEWEKAEEARRVAQAQLEELKAQQDKLRRGSRRETVDQAQAGVAEIRAELKYQKALLADYTIAAPFDALVIESLVEPGETVDIAAPLLSLIDPDQLRIHAEVEESDVGRVVLDQQVAVTVDNLPGKTYSGKVYRIFPTVSRKSQRTFDPMASFDINTQKVYITLDDYAGLVHGMTVNVRFLE
ncbi:MAG: HlyD family efflux transporter periplasmic adaptor subunit [Trichloromonas sp.]|jgi:multidrug resistance efflux pump|nr:HlyD family efflux transporter periplasmic adaptor subunit [Trichloromonas sp.]